VGEKTQKGVKKKKKFKKKEKGDGQFLEVAKWEIENEP